MYTSPTTINASAGIGSMLTYINDVTNLWASKFIIIAIFLITLFAYLRSNRDWVSALAVSSYTTFIITTLLWLSGFVDGWTYGYVIGGTLIFTGILLLDRK